MYLIGSRALNLRAPGLLENVGRKCLDFDWICTKEEFDKWMETTSHLVNPTKVYALEDGKKMIVEGATNCEFELILPGTSAELLAQLVDQDSDTMDTSFGKVPSLDLLFTIKDSHKYKKFNQTDRGFWKTTLDWHVMKHVGAQVRPEYLEFSKLRKSEMYNYKHPSLNQNKMNFFQDQYLYEHDDIHKAIALYDQPAYTFYMEDGQEVKSSKKKFFEVSEDIRLAGVLEEALTLALERSQIAHPGVWTTDQSFKFALAKVCTSITSGFFREYAFNNVFSVFKLYEKTSKNYLDKFNQAVKDGKVRFMDKVTK